MENSAQKKVAKVNWKWVILFYAIAFCLSAPFNSGYLLPWYQQVTSGTIFYDAGFLFAGFGTLVAGLLAFLLHQDFPRALTTFWGRAKGKNFTIAIVPLIVYTLVGIPNGLNQNVHLYAFKIGVLLTIYALAEEVFWRGYLINALSPLGNAWDYFVLGLLWWAWHFPFMDEFGYTAFLGLIIGSSFLIGRFVEKSKSYLTAVGLHAMIILVDVGNTEKPMLYAAGAIIVIWVVLDWVWKEGREVDSKTSSG